MPVCLGLSVTLLWILFPQCQDLPLTQTESVNGSVLCNSLQPHGL